MNWRNFSKIGCAHIYTPVGVDDVTPKIPVLLGPTAPLAVVKAVGAIIVDPVDRVIKRPLAHIRGEPFKVIPFLANPDASAAIVLVGRVIRIIAPIPKTRPNAIKIMVNMANLFASAWPCATAIYPCPPDKLSRLRPAFFPAIAYAIDKALGTPFLPQRKNCKIPVSCGKFERCFHD